MKGKAPLYIGIFVQHQKQAQDQLKQYTLSCLKQIYSHYPSPQVLQDIQHFSQTFSKTKDAPHLTTLFIGKTKIDQLPQKSSIIYEQFLKEQNNKFEIILEGIVYVPGHIIAALTFPKVRCGNDYPHVTLYLGKNAKAVESNEICDWVFKESENEEVYKARKFETKEYHPEGFPVKFKGVFVTGRELVLPGVYRRA